MIVACWSGEQEQRWGIHAVCKQLSVSSIREILLDEDIQAKTKIMNVVSDALSNDSYPVSSTLQEVFEVNKPVSQALVNLIDKGGCLQIPSKYLG